MINWTKAVLVSLFIFLACFYWGRFSGFTGFSFAWILNLILMAWFTYLDSLFRWKYVSSYFNSRPFEKNGNIYTLFGVQFFRKLLVWIGWEKLNKKDNEITYNRKSIQHAEHRTRSSEAGHTIIFFIVGIVTLMVANSLQDAVWLVFLNLLLNIFPVFVQRYNRPRYRRVLGKMNLQQN